MVCSAYGAPLVPKELEQVALKKGQVRIKTAYAGINYAGIHSIRNVITRSTRVQGEIPGAVQAALYAGTGGERRGERMLRVPVAVEGRPRVLHLLCEWRLFRGVRG